jgi:hypothetical protein
MRGRLFATMGVLFLVGCAALRGMEEREKIYGKEVPVITQSFASQQVTMRENWRVYINASDPDGDMDQVVCYVDFQAGLLQPYPIGFTKVGKDQQKNLSGYLYLDTSGLLRPISIILVVQIRDKAGHFSAPVSLSVNIGEPSQKQKEIRQEDPPRGIFQDKNLGPIMIVLTSEIG